MRLSNIQMLKGKGRRSGLTALDVAEQSAAALSGVFGATLLGMGMSKKPSSAMRLWAGGGTIGLVLLHKWLSSKASGARSSAAKTAVGFGLMELAAGAGFALAWFAVNRWQERASQVACTTPECVGGRFDIAPGESRTEEGHRDQVTEASMESFPASDPAPY